MSVSSVKFEFDRTKFGSTQLKKARDIFLRYSKQEGENKFSKMEGNSEYSREFSVTTGKKSIDFNDSDVGETHFFGLYETDIR